MKKENPKHEIFIREMIAHGNQTKAYMAAYGANRKSAGNSASRLMRNNGIAERVEAGQNAIAAEAHNAQLNLVKEKLQTFTDIRDALSDIATGKRKFEKLYKIGKGVEPFETSASAAEIVSALNACVKLFKLVPEEKPKIIKRILIEAPKTEDSYEFK